MIVVTGATGNVGRPLVRALAEAGEQVTAVSRTVPAPSPSSSPAGGEPPRGVRHQPADLADPASLKPALDGADALFLLVAGAGEGLDVPAVLDAARSGGVRRVVLLSSQAVGTRPQAASHAPLRGIEEAVRGSGMDWTVLRPNGFFSNAFRWAPGVRDERVIAAPFADTGLPLVDPDDIAAVAAAALRDPAHAGRTYVLTGPEPVTPRAQAAAIGAAIGEEVRFAELSREQAREGMLRFMPEPVVEGTLAIIGEPTADERRVSPDVEQVLGRTPGTFTAWAARNAEAFR